MMKKNKEIEIKNRILSREKIPKRFCWDIESLYKNNEAWEEDYQRVKQIKVEVINCKERFTRDANSFLRCLQLRDEISKLVQKIFTYAHMRKDEDNKNNTYQSIFYKASTLLVEIEESLSFIEPGILSLDKKIFQKWTRKHPQLIIYKHYIENVYRKKKHILSFNEERIIAQVGEMAMIPENSFHMLSHADLKFSRVKSGDGKIIPISHGNFISLLRKKDREFRKKVFKKYYEPYQLHANTFATLLAGNLKKDRFFSYARKYKDSLEAALFEDNIPASVYENLLNIVHQKIGLLHHYILLKKEFLKIEPYHMYDMYVPLSHEMEYINYQKAQEMIVDALTPLGKSYLSVIGKSFKERWIDIYENKGKTSGAYSTGSYQSKPFILLNYQGTLEDIYTLAHELGHSLHSYYAHQNQPFVYSGYSIFLAEIASTTNEALLTHYLLTQAQSHFDRLTILNHFLEQFRTTLFRQSMFAEFERIIHEYDEKGESLTTEWFCKKYDDLNHYYYGKNVIIDQEITFEWARIPHFYYHYYVYQYATGFAAAIAISRKILQEGEPAVQKYIKFLSKGSSDYPITILKKAGVDMTTTRPLEEAMDLFGELLNQLETLREPYLKR